MASPKTAGAIVVVLGVVPAVLICVANSFLPGWTDLKDPLGRPATLSESLIDSADRLDTLTAQMVPKHEDLAGGIQTLAPLSANLTDLTNAAGTLPPSAVTVNTSTRAVADIAAPLPQLIAVVTGHSVDATSMVGELTTAVDGVTGELTNVDTEMASVQTSLAALGPQASGISATLSNIEEEASRVGPLGPVLAVLGPLVNGPKQPAPPVQEGR